ncbi:MAG: tetratricopeptide repeat protein, partial [Planctomycetes bacterium]|nr:tetratricopeptide repeat protein [Planctomycetota bacterium]
MANRVRGAAGALHEGHAGQEGREMRELRIADCGLRIVGLLAASLSLCAPGGFAGEVTLEKVYEGYDPAFSADTRQKTARGPDAAALKASLQFSTQANYLNMADVAMDSQIRPLVEKANELVGRQEHRKATELYRKVLQEYGDDLYKIAEEGVFIPAALYVQHRILAYPKKELAYYRVAYDPVAKEVYERALKRYSIFDYKELVKRHLATSYGDDGLLALGNAAADRGLYDEARRCYEQLLALHGLQDEDSDGIALDRDQVWVRLAICYKHLGEEQAFQQAASRVRNRNEPTVTKLLAQLERLKHDAFALRQREGKLSARYDSLDDRSLSEPMPYSLSANRGEWTAPLGSPNWGDEPEARPWVTATDVVYKDMNVLYSRSLLTGETNWVFSPGGSSFDWDRYTTNIWARWYVEFCPRQSILLHEGVVLANMFVYGPSLVAVDEYTGRLLWSKGPMAAATEDEWLDRYQAAPAPGRGIMVAPVVHDDIRGLSHISSTAELAAFETRTGKLLWRTTLARIAPLKITQSRYPRKIRIFSTRPLLKDNVVYHVTNAGVVAAVDAQTGDVRWLTRYPQNPRTLDNLVTPGERWYNDAPLIRGHRLYVTPVDCDHLLCLDTETGKVLWSVPPNSDSTWHQSEGRGARKVPHMRSMVGFTPDGLLCLRDRDVVFLEPETGKLAWHYGFCGWGWLKHHEGNHTNPYSLEKDRKPPKGLSSGITGEGEDYWYELGRVWAPPTLTRDGKLYLSMQNFRGDPYPYAGPFVSEFCLDLRERAVTAQRRWYHPPAFIHDSGQAPPVAKRVVNEELEAFSPASRMAFTRWGIPFELDIKHNQIVARYDRKKLDEQLAKGSDLNTLFAKAELARKRGQVKESIGIYETCKTQLPSEENDFRRNINLRLYPLYMRVAQWGYQSGNLDEVETACKKMGASASNPSQELRALLAYSELHERRGNWDQAVGVLQNATLHYWREPLITSNLETGNRQELMATAEKALANLLGEVPAPYGSTATELAARERAGLADYFLSVADMGEDRVVETRSLVAQRLLALVARAPEAFRKRYEELAAAALRVPVAGNGRAESWDVAERLLWCWPGTAAARAKLADLYREVARAKGTDRFSRTWRLDDVAVACALVVRPSGRTERDLRAEARTTNLPTGDGWAAKEAENGEPEIVRLALPQRGGAEATAHLLFAGGRKKSAYGNRFTVGCWDMKVGQKLWETQSIFLHGRTMGEEGYETGFEEVWLHGDLAIVHGRYDVIALRWAHGKDMVEGGRKEKRWHFRAPLGFEIQSVAMQGPLVVLCGRSRTLALLAETGDIVWDEQEDGEYYAGPFFHGDTVLTVRSSPAGAAFRRVGSGRLLSWLRLPGLSTNRKHPLYLADAGTANPAAAQAAEACPVAFGGGKLAVVDGRNFHMVDVQRMELDWSTPATKLDPTMDPAYRMWLDGGRLLVLKPYYSVL